MGEKIHSMHPPQPLQNREIKISHIFPSPNCMQVRVSDVKARKTISNDLHQLRNGVVVSACDRDTQPRKEAIDVIVGVPHEQVHHHYGVQR